MPVSLVVVTNMDGLPLYFDQYTDLHLEVDPALFSGFLAAMASFSRAVRKDFQLMDVGLGEIRLFFDHGAKAITIVGVLSSPKEEKQASEIEISEKIKNHREIVSILNKQFHKNYNTLIDEWDGNPQAFESFKLTAETVLGSEVYSTDRTLENLLGDFDSGRIDKGDLVNKIWDIVTEDIETMEET